MKKMATLLAVFIAVCSYAEDVKKDDSAELQNAESATVPREIPIGLPEGGTGAMILEDGTQLAPALARNYHHWAGGNAYSSTRVMGLTETLITCGQIAMAVDSRTRIGDDIPYGAFSLRTSTNGLFRFDGATSFAFPKGKGWYYSTGIYVNMDPTSTNAPNRKFVDQKQILKTCVTKKWGSHAEVSAMYKLSLCEDASGNTYSYAPFVYDGAGGVTTLGGFRLGRDRYFMEDDYVEYKDVLTGRTRSGNISKMDHKILHDIHIDGRYDLDCGWQLGAHLQLCTLPTFSTAENSMGGIVRTSSYSGGVTYPDGSPYTGEHVQLRISTPHEMEMTSFYGLATARKTSRRSELELGFMYLGFKEIQRTSSFAYAHEVCASPQRLYISGKGTWNLNSNSMYFDAKSSQFTGYVLEDWDVTSRLHLRGGLRVMVPFYLIHSAANRSGQTDFIRYDGFSIADIGGMEALNTFTQKDIDAALKFDYHAIASATYKLADGLFLMGDGFYSITNKATTYYKGNRLPSLKPIGNALARLGLTWNRKTASGSAINASLICSYITCWDCAGFSNITNHQTTAALPYKNMETATYVAEYGIGTPGITLDGNYRRGRFNLHLMATYVNPRYKDYDNDVLFSDGHIERVSYSGKITTGISRVRVELDPTYSWGDWSATLNLRYFSKQYASRNNLAYFKGHFETFGNVDWRFTKNCKLSLYLVNLLFQNGTKGGLSSAADSAESEAELAGAILAGTYIRPFTVDLGFTYKF